MRPIHVLLLDKPRPVLVLTREIVRDQRDQLTVAPITSRVRGIVAEVQVGPRNGSGHDSVVNCDNVLTVNRALLGERIGWLLPDQEAALSAAIRAAFDLSS
jgi:mRNA interferase MazF